MTAEIDYTTVPLSAADETRLGELETIIETGLEKFIAVGTAIAEIRESKLYRATHGTFETYVADRWEISRSRAYQLMAAAHVSTVVDTAGLPAPANESQARMLASVPDVEIPAVWQDALTSGTPSRPTAKDVENAVDRRASTRVEEPTRPPKTPRRKPLPDAFRAKEREATKAVKAMTRMATKDGRWDQYLDQIRDGCRSDIERLINALQDLRSVMDGGGISDEDYPEVVIVKGTNTAFVHTKWHARIIRAELKKMGVQSQTKRQGSQSIVQFPTKYAVWLRDTLLAQHVVAEVVDE